MKTVKVRIAVAVDPDGDWHACGWSGSSDETMMRTAVDTIAEGERRYWIEAELEVPDAAAATVQATVTSAPSE